MIASTLTLDTTAMHQFTVYDAYAIHRVVYDLFPGTKRNFLYYHYPQASNRGTRILILSETQPLLPFSGSLESKFVQNSFLEHNHYAFKVRLNPVIRTQEKARSILRQDELIQWFAKKQSNWGFHADIARLELSNKGVIEIKGKEGSMVFNECTFTGVLEVVDRKSFIKSFCEGIGRGKAFGFGLLQLLPLYE